MTQPIQTLANNCEIISKSHQGYGHYKLVMQLETNTGREVIVYTTTTVQLIDDLNDDDIDVVNSAKESLMNMAMISEGIEKSNEFEYIY